jgi:glycosyltransferase involved in cell wall biosynthesis
MVMLERENQAGDRAVEMPLVSAIVLCYNHARFVVEALESVRLQTYPRIQLIILDDCSKDASVSIIKNWIEQCGFDCIFLRHERNQGLCASLNHALEHAQGKYLAAFAADDLWLPNKTAYQVELLERGPEIVAVTFSDAFQINDAGARLPEAFISAHRPMPRIPTGKIFDQLWEGNFIPAMTAMIRRKCLEQVGHYDESLAYEDWDMWLRLSQRFEFLFCPEPLACYRLVGTSMVRTMMPAILESSARICVKLLESGGLDRSQRSLATSRLLHHAKSRYYDKFPDASRWLRLALSYKFDPWAFVLLACVGLRIPPWWVNRFHRQVYAWMIATRLKKQR